MQRYELLFICITKLRGKKFEKYQYFFYRPNIQGLIRFENNIASLAKPHIHEAEFNFSIRQEIRKFTSH